MLLGSAHFTTDLHTRLNDARIESLGNSMCSDTKTVLLQSVNVERDLIHNTKGSGLVRGQSDSRQVSRDCQKKNDLNHGLFTHLPA